MERHHNGSLFSKNLGPSSMDQVGSDRFRIVFQRNLKKRGKMRGFQTPDEGNSLAIAKLDVFLRVISLVDDQGEPIGGFR